MDTSALRYPEANAETFEKDETIFLSGSIGMHMYVVLQGQVQIKMGDRIVDVINPGGVFGEMALVDARPRAGTAVAATKVSLLSFNEQQFMKLMHDSPEFAMKIVRSLVAMVRRADGLGHLDGKSS
jgi:CRP/FNR family transcriptional regulator, cyclic AMP receptor protein